MNALSLVDKRKCAIKQHKKVQYFFRLHYVSFEVILYKYTHGKYMSLQSEISDFLPLFDLI